MRLTLQRSGGFAAVPGLSRHIVVDTAELPAAEAETVHQLVSSASLDERPARIEPRAGAADMITFRLTVDDGERHHVLHFTDPISDPALDALVSQLLHVDRR